MGENVFESLTGFVYKVNQTPVLGPINNFQNYKPPDKAGCRKLPVTSVLNVLTQLVSTVMNHYVLFSQKELQNTVEKCSESMGFSDMNEPSPTEQLSIRLLVSLFLHLWKKGFFLQLWSDVVVFLLSNTGHVSVFSWKVLH